MEEFQQLKISQCFESPTNPRGGKFEGKEFDDLIASVKEKGVLMPVLARPQKGKFEIVAGNRRFRAAKEAGLKEIPARVQDMTDTEAREAQIVENLQRADVHPLEEGGAYRDLIEKSGYDVAAVAEKVGKSESYVRDRLVLTNLIKKGQKAFRDGLITAGHAALVARLDEALQLEALTDELDIDDESEWREVPSTAQLREWIQQRTFAEAMQNPPWSGDDETKAALGGCDECKGKGGDLFGKKAADACTNPKCYAQRLAAFIDMKVKEQPDLVKLSANYSGSEDIPGSGHYKVITGKKDGCDHEEKGIIVEGRAYGDQAGIGHIIRFCRAPECKKHWPDQKPQGHYKPTPEEKEVRRKQAEQEKKRKAKQAADFQAALAKLKLPLSEKHIDALFEYALGDSSYTVLQPTVTLMGLDPVTKQEKRYVSSEKTAMRTVIDHEATLRQYAKKNGNVGKMRVAFALIMPHPSDYSQNFEKGLKRL